MIPKPPIAQWRTRPLYLTDINSDGTLDIIGFLIQAEGNLPKDEAAIYWMEYSGTEPRACFSRYPAACVS